MSGRAHSGSPPSGGNGTSGARVLLAMSGGVDSSTSAKLLLDAGYDVVGATMVLLNEGDAERAKDACDGLGIDHIALDMRDRFAKRVIEPFCASYVAGETPNPCVRCNESMKFGELHRVRAEQGFDYLATGHYARRAWDAGTGRWQLLCAADASKDQTYFLYNITQDQLSHTLFPLGDKAKDEVRAIAAREGLPAADSAESQDICFIDDAGHVPFIARRLEGMEAHHPCRSSMSAAFTSGDIVDGSGTVLGRHEGLINYTLGQRKGIGIAAAEPLYVTGKDMERNELVVGFARDADVTGFLVRDPRMVSVDGIDEGRSYMVKSHYRQVPVAARVHIREDGLFEVLLSEPCRITSPGQSLVIYDGDMLVAGGVIDRPTTAG